MLESKSYTIKTSSFMGRKLVISDSNSEIIWKPIDRTENYFKYFRFIAVLIAVVAHVEHNPKFFYHQKNTAKIERNNCRTKSIFCKDSIEVLLGFMDIHDHNF